MVGSQTAKPKLKLKAGRPMTMIGAVLAVLALALSVYMNQASHGSGGSPAATVPVVVAAHDLTLRTPIVAADLTVARFTSADAPPGAFNDVSPVVGLVPEVDIPKGAPLTSNLLAKSPDSVPGAQAAYLPIPSGFVAMTIPTNELTGVAGFIQPGDYISMIAVVKAAPFSITRTVFTNVNVLKIGPAAAASSGSGQTQGVTSSLTVVVTECQAEYLKWFLANEALSYTLESYKDYRPQDKSVDQSCPSVTSARGVTVANVAARWPGLLPGA